MTRSRARPALLVPLAVSALAGTFLGLWGIAEAWWWLMIAVGSTGWVLVGGLGHRTIALLLITTATFAGWSAWRGDHAQSLNRKLEPLVGRLVEIRAQVIDWPNVRVWWIEGSGQCHALARVSGAPQPSGTHICGLVLVQQDERGRLRLRCGGRRATRFHRPSTGTVSGVLRSLHEAASRRLAASPGPEGSAEALVQASVLGRRNGAFHKLYRPFLETGTAHLLAVSGLHLALLAALGLCVRRLVSAPPRCDALILAITSIIMLLLVEVRPPLARSAVMALVLAAGPMLHRRLAGGTALSAALLVALIIDPMIVFRPGPQLSFAVVGALVWVLPVVEARARENLNAGGPLKRAWRAGWVAWAVSTPIIMAHFGRAGPLAVPAAIAMVPVLTALLAAGWIRVLSPDSPLDVLTGWVLEVTAQGLLWAVDVIALIPGSAVVGTPQPLWWALAALAAVLWLCIRPGRWAWIMVGCVVAALGTV